MTRIRVDPDELAQASERLAQIADRFRQLEYQVHELGVSAPSYDGQFGPRVREASDQGAAQLRKLADNLTELSDKLGKKGKEFREIDALSAEGLHALSQIVARQWCPIPLMDIDAVQHHVAYAELAFGRPPFASPVSIPSHSTYEGYTADPRLIALKAAGFLMSLARREANYQAVTTAEPNVRIELHYPRYEDGITVAGLRLDNRHDLPVVPFRVELYEFAVAPDGGLVAVDGHTDKLGTYIEPGEFAYVEFGPQPLHYRAGSLVYVMLRVKSAGRDGQFFWPAWILDAATGEAIRIEPGVFLGE